ncbi:MAG: FlgB family protein [Rhodobacter sp.]|nr:FlgB family protein [Rhodobacter sp.]
MYGTLEIFRMAHGLAVHASARQSAIAGNVANADTPGYRAQDIAPFSETYRAEPHSTALRGTRAGHLGGEGAASPEPRTHDAPGPSAPNGNTVSLETEMMKGVEVRQTHEMALSIYKTSLDILRTSLGRAR